MSKYLNLLGVTKSITEYISAKKIGNLVFTYDQYLVKDRKFIYVEKVGGEISLEEVYEVAKIYTLNCLLEIKSV